MKKMNIVRKNLEFNDIINSGKRNLSKYFYIYTKDNSFGYNRYGIAVSTKVGNAVVRNKLKRQIKDIIDDLKINNVNKDIVFIAKAFINDKNYIEIKNDIINYVEKIGDCNEK